MRFLEGEAPATLCLRTHQCPPLFLPSRGQPELAQAQAQWRGPGWSWGPIISFNLWPQVTDIGVRSRGVHVWSNDLDMLSCPFTPSPLAGKGTLIPLGLHYFGAPSIGLEN